MMKFFHTTVLAVIFTALSAQSTSENYVRTTAPQIAVDNPADLASLPDIQKQTTVTYYDGLGRPTQELAHRQSPAQKDVVQVIEYDAFGRQSTQYLPYVSSSGDMSIKNDPTVELLSFYKTKARVAHSDFPFSEIVFDNSPLNRTVEQSAPGVDWQLGNGHTLKTGYLTNISNEVRLWTINASEEIVTDGYYSPGELQVMEMEDEQGAKTYEYKDKSGNVVLRKAQFGTGTADYTYTYYVYDLKNQLIAVIPPQVFYDLTNQPWPPGNLNASLGAGGRIYTYKYDARGRVVEKKIPHKGVEYIVYNKLDLPIMTQDAKQRLDEEWSFVKYDVMGRVILTGLIRFADSDDTREGRQAMADSYTAQWENRTWQNFTDHHGYTYNAYPNPISSNYRVYNTINYYDDYDFDNDGTADEALRGTHNQTTYYSAPTTARTRGFVTGAKVRVLPGLSWLGTTTFYDELGRAIEIQSDNQLGGEDLVFNAYNFVNQVTHTLHEHTTDPQGGGYIETEQRFTYDHAGRLLRTYHRVQHEPEVILSENKYNELGQLIDKRLHSTNLVSPKYLQSVDYAYNIRGWLTHINNDDLNDDEYNDSPIYGAVVGHSMASINFTVREIEEPAGEGEEPTSYLALLINDESELMVEGVVNTELYQNGESKLIKLMDAPAVGEDPVYSALQPIEGVELGSAFDPPYMIDETTTLEDLTNWIYPDVQTTLESNQMTDPEAVSIIQQAVFNYVAGKAGQVMTIADEEVFATPDINIYFYEQNGYNLYVKISDVHNSLSTLDRFVMSKTTANETEYNFLFNLTNPLDDPNDPNSPRTADPRAISFAQANLYEGMGTVEAITACEQVVDTRMEELLITNSTVINHVKAFARRYILDLFGNQFFNDDANDLWGMEIKYNYPTLQAGSAPLGGTSLFNGNISETTWKSKGDEVKRGYGYQYDLLNRINSATYKAYDGSLESWSIEANRYNVAGISYDLNGNILSLQRNGFTDGSIASPTFGSMDNLAYSYNGDQLMAVSDISNNPLHVNDFVDGPNSGNDYSYDVNGNLTGDKNKGIPYSVNPLSGIYYNHLNLPVEVRIDEFQLVQYVYDATGVKLQKLHTDDGMISSATTYYTAIGNYTSPDQGATLNLDFIFTPEGRLVKDAGNWRYEYYYKDHLGNTRLGFSDYDGDEEVDASEITQQHNYYPFGLEHKGMDYGVAAQAAHRYLYNAKEMQDELSLGWYDFGARMNMADIGRWGVVDPLAEDYIAWSPYNSMINNPIFNIDPDGRGAGDYYDADENYLGNDGIDDDKVYTVEGTSKFNIKDVQEGGKYFENHENFNENNGNGYSIIYEGMVVETKLSFTGQMNEDNSKQADGTVKLIQVLDNGKEFTQQSLGAVGGPFGNGAPPNGDYTVDSPRLRTEQGFSLDGFGFSFNLNPTFETNRTLLRVHPDGNTPGTLGCVGVKCSEKTGRLFYDRVSSVISKSGPLNMNIDITGNPNNQGGGIVPNVNE